MSELELHVDEGNIIVNMRHTRLTMTYTKPSDAPWLVEEPFWTRYDGNAPLTLNEFRARAWEAATKMARELGWISALPSLIQDNSQYEGERRQTQ